MIHFGSGIMGFEMKSRQPTRVGSGYRVRNLHSTAGVVGSGGGGLAMGRCARLSGLPVLLDSLNHCVMRNWTLIKVVEQFDFVIKQNNNIQI